MTILIAAKSQDGKGIHLLSDSLGTDGQRKYNLGTKWTECTNFYIAVSGDVTAKLVIREFLQEQLNSITIQGKKDVIGIYKSIEATMKAEFGAKITENDDRDYLDFDMLIVTKAGKIYSCSQFLNIDEHEEFIASGSGSAYATSILKFIYHHNFVIPSNLTMIMDIVYEYQYHCGGPTHYLYLTIPENE